MPLSYIIAGLLTAVAGIFSVHKSKLTIQAGIAGWLIGFVIFCGAGWAGLLMLSMFFVLGTLATAFGKKQKQQMGVATEKGIKRTTGQVLANAGVAALLSVSMLLSNEFQSIGLLMIAAAFSSATADTLSSELGNLYGKQYFNILTFRKDQRGLNGVVSIEGTLLGLAGSVAIALSYAAARGVLGDFLLIILTGTLGNLTDSVLGATAERKGWLSNNSVNWLNTAAAALAAYWLRTHT